MTHCDKLADIFCKDIKHDIFKALRTLATTK